MKVLLFIVEAPELFLSVGGASDADCTDRSTILPGFIRFSGSKDLLIVRMTSSASPCSSYGYFILPYPMPCSPVQVPPSARRAGRVAPRIGWLPRTGKYCRDREHIRT